MRRRSRRGDDKADVNMTPMLDIVFILLIFFIVTATFIQEEGLSMVPPPPVDEPPDTESSAILVQVDNDNNIFVNRDRTSVDRVIAAVSRIRAEEPGSAVVIQPENDADHGIVVKIWDDMNLNSIPVAITRDEGGEG